MPIAAYTGDVGSGKTYSVVLHVIIPAITAGRSICTNIAGLDIDAIYAYCLTKAKLDKIICLGVIRIIDKSAPEQENFFPFDEDLPPEDYNVQPGELVIIDEASRYWYGGGKIHLNHAKFINEHRHFVNAQGHTCDLVVIDPDVTELHRRLKSKVETTYYTKKLKEVGLTNNYVVFLHRKTNLRAKEYDKIGPLKYDPEVYALYHSYKGGVGSEQATDKRQNVFSSRKIWYKVGGTIAAIIVLTIVGGYQLKHFFNRDKPDQPKIAQGEKSTVPAGSVPPSSSPQKAVSASSAWRIVGKYMKQGYPVFLLVDGSGNYRYFSPVPAVQPTATMQIMIDGEKFNSWSGGATSKGIL